MLKKGIYIYIYLSNFFNPLFGQNTYKALYKARIVEINYDSVFKENKKIKKHSTNINLSYLKKQQKLLSDLSKKTYLTLEYNEVASKFYINDVLENDGINSINFSNRINIDGFYFTDSKQTLNNRNSYGQEFIIDFPKYKWNIENISKKVANYNCYKATTIKKILTISGIKKLKITAWFAPEIAFNYGPKEYSGLPGLILKLTEGGVTYQIEKIEKIENKIINEPTKGKKVTIGEFEAIGKKMYESLND